ncbi:MAG: Mu transposase C-terminal domain-containing protein [Syntrophobacterales bacterium]|nr:Mu transposase C-terminal domain-containing protein [Syntrophobacterales bacterium]
MDRLNRDFLVWVDGYHQKKHTGTGQTPLARFAAHTPCLRHAPDNLRDYFRQTVLRRVAKDRTVTINGRLFEAPVRLIGKRVTLFYHDDHPEAVEVVFNGQSHGMIPLVDIHVNCRVKRDKNSQAELTPAASRYQGGRLWGNGGNDE